MNTIKFSYDRQSFQSKPSGNEIQRINNRIARSVQKLDRNELVETVTKIGSMGHTFSPATFKNGKRNKDNFELSLGRSKTYQFLEEVYQKQEPFRVIKVGKLFRVPQKSFDEWLDAAK